MGKSIRIGYGVLINSIIQSTLRMLQRATAFGIPARTNVKRILGPIAFAEGFGFHNNRRNKFEHNDA
jgi:hypothetical protein